MDVIIGCWLNGTAIGDAERGYLECDESARRYTNSQPMSHVSATCQRAEEAGLCLDLETRAAKQEAFDLGLVAARWRARPRHAAHCEAR